MQFSPVYIRAESNTRVMADAAPNDTAKALVLLMDENIEMIADDILNGVVGVDEDKGLA